MSVIGTFMKAALAEPMHHLAGSDVWYRTFRMPAGARFSYFLSSNAPLIFDGPEAAQQFATLQADPLNPHRWMCGPDADIYQCQSRAELPGVAAQPWVAERATVEKGALTQHHIASRILDNSRAVLAAAFVALRHPSVVGNVLSQSGNFAWAPNRAVGPDLDATSEGGWLINEYVNAPSSPFASISRLACSKPTGSLPLGRSSRARDIFATSYAQRATPSRLPSSPVATTISVGVARSRSVTSATQ